MNNSMDRANSEILDLNNPYQREEEHKSNELNLEDPNSSLVNEPQIHGVFNSVEQNLIAIEST